MNATTLCPVDLTQKPLRIRSGINHVVFDPSGRFLAATDAYMGLKVYRDGALELEYDFNFYDDRIRSTQRIRGVVFNRDGSLLHIAAADMLYSLDLATNKVVWSYTAPRSFGFLVISPTSVSATDGFFAAAYDNGSIGVWSEDGARQTLFHHNDCPRQFAFSSDGNLVGTDSFTLTTWDWHSRSRTSRMTLPNRAYGFEASRWSSVCAIWTLHAVELWDTASATRIASLPNGFGLPAIALHPSRPLVAIGDQHGATFFDYGGANLGTHATDSPVMSVVFSPDGSSLACGCSNAEIVHLAVPAIA